MHYLDFDVLWRQPLHFAEETVSETLQTMYNIILTSVWQLPENVPAPPETSSSPQFLVMSTFDWSLDSGGSGAHFCHIPMLQICDNKQITECEQR